MAQREKDPEAEPLYPQSRNSDEEEFVNTAHHKHNTLSQHKYVLGGAYLLLIILYLMLGIEVTKLKYGDLAAKPDLFPYTTIRVSQQDLDHYNITSLPLADGSGFMSEIFMTHELHCLKKVRQWMYKETYFTDVQGLTRNELKRHVDHCIETLRQGIMCRGDVSLATYTYFKGSSDVTARTWGTHECVNFDALMAWSRSRAVNMFQDGILAKPEDLGPEHFTTRKPPH
ncbi:MAG: hypothetical protein Q9227_000092 [Pyrenula ochraceoflavens]